MPFRDLKSDNNVRADASLDKLAKLKPVFDLAGSGTMTAGNSTPLTDGSAALLLASESWAASHGLPVLAYLRAGKTWAVDFASGNEGLLMAPAYAVAAILRDTGLTLQEFDYYEIHEAFAAVPLCLFKAWESADYCRERLGAQGALGSIDTARINVKGGSVAIGHPFAATGARILAMLAKLLAGDSSARSRSGIGLHGRRHGGDRDSGARVSQSETLMARDGHTFGAYIAKPPGKARGGIVIIQEIFGLSAHIRRVADELCRQGYLAVAPALFDRVARGIVLGHSPPEVEQGLGYRKQITTAKAVLDIAAAAAICRHAGRVAVIGYCWGGRLAWAAASEVALGAAVVYYGGGILEELPKVPRCPTILHFGTKDKSIPASDIEQLRAACPRASSTSTRPGMHSTTTTGRRVTMPRPARWHASAPWRSWRSTSASQSPRREPA